MNAIEVRDVRKTYRRYGRRKSFGTLKSAILTGRVARDMKADDAFEVMDYEIFVCFILFNNFDSFDGIRKTLRRMLLKKTLACHAVGTADERERTPGDVWEDPMRDLGVVIREIEFRDAKLGI